MRRCSVRHDAAIVFGPSIATLEFGFAADVSPDQPVNTYRVPVGPLTVPATPNGATSDALFHPDPVGDPWADVTVRRNWSWNVARNSVGAVGLTAWYCPPPSLQEMNTYRMPVDTT